MTDEVLFQTLNHLQQNGIVSKAQIEAALYNSPNTCNTLTNSSVEGKARTQEDECPKKRP